MARSTKTFSEADWRKAMETATKKTPGGYMSRRELMVALKMSDSESKQRLRELSEADKLDTRQELRMTYDGKWHPRSVYRLKDVKP